MKPFERERSDWIIIPIILVIGFLCVIIAGQWALRFSPSWKLDADMESNLDPNRDFLTRRPNGFVEAIDPSILTQPAWVNFFLTPGASYVTGTPFPATTATVLAEPTMIPPVTNTVAATVIPPNTLVSILWVPSSTSKPANRNGTTATFTPTSTPTSTATSTPTSTDLPTPIPTSTDLPTPTPTNTSDSSEPDFGAPDGNVYILTDGACLSFDLGASNAIAVSGTPELAYDLVYYEKAENPAVIFMDWVTITVAESPGGPWYSGFNWGDSIPDANSNVSGITENDNQPINMGLPLYGTPPLQTGITIDIDNVGMPAGTYQWVQICAPLGGDGDGLEIDSIEALP